MIKTKTIKIIAIWSALLFLTTIAQAQTGGDFTITKSIISSGGRQSAAGDFTVKGIIGQTTAGVTSAGDFTVKSSYRAEAATTAKGVSISGRVTGDASRGLVKALVYLTNQNGQTRVARTGKLGAYRFDDIAAGQTVIMMVVSKRYGFASQVFNVTEDLSELNFIALP